MTKQRKRRTYYTLLERMTGQLWAPQFGDYDKEVVEQERRDMKDSGSFVKGTSFKIVETDGTQADLTRVVEEENEWLRTKNVIVPKQPADVRKNLAKLERGGKAPTPRGMELLVFTTDRDSGHDNGHARSSCSVPAHADQDHIKAAISACCMDVIDAMRRKGHDARQYDLNVRFT